MPPQVGREDGVLSPDVAAGPFIRPVFPPGPDDLLILARDDLFYWLKKDVYQNDAHVIELSTVGPALGLVELGVVLAEIPVDGSPGGPRCFLVNLRGIQRPPPRFPGRPQGEKAFEPPPLSPDDPCLRRTAPAAGDLVIVERDGTRAFWVRTCEFQRPVCELRQIEPILDLQVRLLTNQGVVLADVPGGSILGVNDMGCLVNLNGLQPRGPPTRGPPTR